MEQVYYPFYDSNANSPTDDPLLSHRLSLLFMVLAIGSLVDLRTPAYNLEAEKYHQLARAALFRNGLFDEPTNHVVQALVSISIWFEFMKWLTSKGCVVPDVSLPLSSRSTWTGIRGTVGYHGHGCEGSTEHRTP